MSGRAKSLQEACRNPRDAFERTGQGRPNRLRVLACLFSDMRARSFGNYLAVFAQYLDGELHASYANIFDGNSDNNDLIGAMDFHIYIAQFHSLLSLRFPTKLGMRVA